MPAQPFSPSCENNKEPILAVLRDVFAGTRITLNDEQDTNIIAGAFWDRSNDTTSIRIEFERRIGANYKLEIEFQGFVEVPTRDPFFSFRRDSFLQVDFRRYF